MIWDDNHISIEDDTDIAFTEDVVARYEAYGWHTQCVDWTARRTGYAEDVDALHAAIEAAKAETDSPSFIALRTIIALADARASRTPLRHGSTLGADEVRGLKEVLGLDPEKTFDVDPEVLAHTRGRRRADRAGARPSGQRAFDAWRTANPERAALLERLVARRAARRLDRRRCRCSRPARPSRRARRRARSSRALAPVLPELWGGSADLAGSNNTTMKGEPSFIPAERSTHEFAGRRVRPHAALRHPRARAWARSSTGIVLHGLTRALRRHVPQFSDYMRGVGPARRRSWASRPSYVWTHDSIGLGEDGPTHQPIEHLAALRAIPGLTSSAPPTPTRPPGPGAAILEHTDGPVGLILHPPERPDVPARRPTASPPPTGVAQGGYVLLDAEHGTPDVILIGTGSEVQLAVEAREHARGRRRRHPRRVGAVLRVVRRAGRRPTASRCCRPRCGPASRVEAGIALGWHELVGDAGRIVSLEHYGASADYQTLFREFGITAEAVVAAAHESIAAAARRGPASTPGPTASGTGDQQV